MSQAAKPKMMHLYSISSNPSKNGEHYYKAMFQNFKMPHIYRALHCVSLTAEVVDLLRRNSSGFSVSMPFKQDIIQYLDVTNSLVTEFNTCNTVVIKDEKMFGFNTDYYGAEYMTSLIHRSDKVSILGNGSMANMFKKLLGERATMYARSLGNWEERHVDCPVIINCTPIGMSSMPGTPLNRLPECSMVIDLVINKSLRLEAQCIEDGVKYIRGGLFYKYQFLNQFNIYTGKKPTTAEFDEIAI
jgi:shikimate dehydrogenase